jgi:RNA polymerase sigma-B factor
MMMHRDTLIAQYCAERSVERRNAVVDAFRPLCVRGARKFKRAGNDRADLEQVAAIGLIKAADYYRSEMQTRFESYAWIMIVGELMHYVRDYERLVRIPRQLHALEKRGAAAWDALCARHHREPTTAELAAELGITNALAAEVCSLRRADRISLPDPAGADGPERIELLADAARGISLEERITLTWALDGLDERDREIVLGTYGAGLTQAELGARLGLSQSHVSKLLARALHALGSKVA